MLRAIGQAHAVRPSGQLPRIATPPTPPWDGYVSQICAAYHQELGADLLSVALRGSTVRATAVIGVSDLDLVVVTGRKVMELDPPHIIAAPDLEVENAMATETELLEDPRFAWLRFNLAFCGHTVWGKDYVSDLPEPVLDRAAVGHLKSADAWLAQWPKMMQDAPDKQERQRICVWLMKRVVRSLFESVMLKEGAYTRDIYPCADLAARHYPTQRGAIFAAAELVVSPTAEIGEIEAALAPLKPTLIAAKDAFLAEAPASAIRA
ncbi:hypothetical protein [uncultured Litoreibacter sp.]|uniref:hypothetical protein n=1 Tax=uncultured Litoreibacter sp. TaxID=1392394 RepID=UPI002606B822|nr:hypothetical protein [uncultured Litoreibacter sp.]